MPEDPYTGTTIEGPSDINELLDDGFYETSLDEDGDISVDDDEILFNVADPVNGATSLLDIASRLYDLADELTNLSEEGWEIVDDVINGHATIVQFTKDGEPE